MCFFKQSFQLGFPYTKMGLTRDLNKGTKTSGVLKVKFLIILKDTEVAFLTLILIWFLKVSNGSMFTQRSFSKSVTSNSVLLDSSPM